MKMHPVFIETHDFYPASIEARAIYWGGSKAGLVRFLYLQYMFNIPKTVVFYIPKMAADSQISVCKV